MKLFSCGYCRNILYFENDRCVVCNHKVGFDPGRLTMVTLSEPLDDGSRIDVTAPDRRYRVCANEVHGVCNWLVPAESGHAFCISCSLNKVIPNLSVNDNIGRWRNLELAKNRLIYTLLRLKLPLTDPVGGGTGLQFEFLSDELAGAPVLTGHRMGLVTINVEEADELQRHINQVQLGEKYRTVLGHFRHEVGHYYWELLVKGSIFEEEFRYLFGDERTDYNEALHSYYHDGPSANWQEFYISRYAAAHPWEDWAETWANYLHLMDTMETAWAFGLAVHPRVTDDEAYQAIIAEDPYTLNDFNTIIGQWLPLTLAMNNLNRSMGHSDFYSFFISPMVMEKLAFIHKVCRRQILSSPS